LHALACTGLDGGKAHEFSWLKIMVAIFENQLAKLLDVVFPKKKTKNSLIQVGKSSHTRTGPSDGQATTWPLV
jgi:hypothetical protein